MCRHCKTVQSHGEMPAQTLPDSQGCEAGLTTHGFWEKAANALFVRDGGVSFFYSYHLFLVH